ncbi:response regulator receiver sensor signal transduction histidine kinase [Candidatus Vecturithrix granuli]|uniref:histidine kinase n=1 Tax=Vecturithrix granuli TaxID=1499967 RepID=A0A081BW53_VECG1|nr:response regulator receiver sensor signal transduction histidine kinase [Candidatus Vecturithrix granuli]
MNDTPIILIVDDNPTNLSVLFEYLEESGYELAVAQSGEETLQQLEHVQPDLILLDVLLPGIDGFELCRQLKEHPATAKIPIVFMTALANDIDKVKGFLAGGVDYITKPLHHEEVLVRINSHLQIQRLQRELKEYQQQLNVQNTLLAQKDERIRELQASKGALYLCVSEKLQQPLDALIGYARLIDDNIEEYGRDEIRNTVRRLRHTAEKLSALYDNLLFWSKIQQNTIEYSPETIALDEIAVYNILLNTPTAEQKRIRLNSTIPEKTLAHADDMMVNVILRNLLANALAFTEPGGEITVSVEEQHDLLEVAVTDTGIGMENEQLHRLFHTPDAEEKTGIGLPLCQALIAKQGGTIRAESERGQGTTIRFTLPKAL